MMKKDTMCLIYLFLGLSTRVITKLNGAKFGTAGYNDKRYELDSRHTTDREHKFRLEI